MITFYDVPPRNKTTFSNVNNIFKFFETQTSANTYLLIHIAKSKINEKRKLFPDPPQHFSFIYPNIHKNLSPYQNLYKAGRQCYLLKNSKCATLERK